MKRGLDAVAEAEMPAEKEARTDGDGGKAARLAPFEIDEMRALILLTHLGDLSTDVATLARCRLVCKSFYTTMNTRYTNGLARCEIGPRDYVSWTFLAEFVRQVATRRVRDPRFMDAQWLARRTIAASCPSARAHAEVARGDVVLRGWIDGKLSGGRAYYATSGERDYFILIVNAFLTLPRTASGLFSVAREIINCHEPDLMRAYIPLVNTSSTPLTEDLEANLIIAASESLEHGCLRVLVEFYPALYAPRVAGARMSDRLRAWLWDHCLRLKDARAPNGKRVMPDVLVSWLANNPPPHPPLLLPSPLYQYE